MRVAQRGSSHPSLAGQEAPRAIQRLASAWSAGDWPTRGDPLWDDALLNDAIAVGLLRRYSARVPRQATASVAVGGGDRFGIGK